MKWIFDAILLAIMLFGLIRGYRSGFITMLFKRFRGIGAMVLAFLVARPVAEFLKLSEKITNPVKELLLQYVGSSEAAEMSDKVPTVLKSLANLFNVDITRYANTAASEGGDYVTSFASAAAEPLADAIAVAGAFLLVLVFGYIALWFVGKLFNLIFKLPVLKQINTLAGAVAGLFFFAVMAWVLCKLSLFAFDLVPDVALLNDFDVETTILGKFLNGIDPMQLLLSF